MIKVYRFAQSWIPFEKTVTLICDFFHALHRYTLCAATAIGTLCFAFWGWAVKVSATQIREIGRKNEKLHLVCQKRVAFSIKRAYYSDKPAYMDEKGHAYAESVQNPIFRSE
jgi:hypothetical protein